MDRLPRILLVSPDLMIASRLAGLARGRADIHTIRSLDAMIQGSPCDLVLLDLQASTGDPAMLIPRIRGLAAAPQPECEATDAGRSARVIAFGPHVAKPLLDAARAAGADDVVSRGELLGGFAALVDRWCG